MSTTFAETVDTTPNTLFNVNMSNVTKLTPTNYMMRSLQVHALLDGYDLSSHLDGSQSPPPATTVTDNVESANPAHTLWKHQDRLIFSGLIGAISIDVQPIVSNSKTAANIWKTLANTYAKPSRGHIQQLRFQIKNWSKGTKSIDEYVQGLTTRFDQLALLGKPMEHENQIDYVLSGLPEEYKQVIDQLEGRDATPSVTKVHEKLLNKEAKLLTASSSLAVHPITANTATNQSSERQTQNYHSTSMHLRTGTKGHRTNVTTTPETQNKPMATRVNVNFMEPMVTVQGAAINLQHTKATVTQTHHGSQEPMWSLVRRVWTTAGSWIVEQPTISPAT